MRRRNYCWTLFIDEPAEEYSESTLLGRLQEDSRVKYCIWQLERCPESGRLHLQGYIELSRALRLGGIKQILGTTVHIEPRRGNRNQARDYCRKEESRIAGPFEYGNFGEANQQGKRSDLLAIRERLEEGATELEIAQEHFGPWCRYYKAFKRYKGLLTEGRSWKTEVHIYWGKAGTGKTKKAYDDAKEQDWAVYDVPRPNGGSVWFDGYEGHEVLLLDDFYGWVPLHLLLKLGDRYAMQIPVKGGMVPFTARRLVITSNSPVDEWYRWGEFNSELRAAFDRRVDITIHFE